MRWAPPRARRLNLKVTTALRNAIPIAASLDLLRRMGFDAILGTPWKKYASLPEDNYVMTAYKNFLEQTGGNAPHAAGKFCKA